VLLAAPAPAFAAGPHAPLVAAGILGTLGGVFGGIGHALLGAFSWTIGLAAKFILTTIAALVKLLIPHSWLHKGVQIVEWIVAVPDYAGKVTTPGGGHVYGFAGINALRDLFMWLGVAVAPLTLVYATSRAMLGESEPVALPTLRVLAICVVIVSYPYWWQQGAALADQVTHTILALPAVSRGLYKLMEYAVDGVALGGWQLIDLGLMGAIALALLALIFLKVVVILLGALLYATGPLMIGLVATEAGSAVGRAWVSAVSLLFALGVCWAALFAVGALLIGDASTAGPLIAGSSTFGTLIGGLLLAIAGLASLWLCLKAAREAGALLRMQLAGLVVISRAQPAATRTGTVAGRASTTGQSLRDYGSRLARGAAAAGGELAGAGGAAIATVARTAGQVGRRGILGSAAAAGRAGAAQVAPHAEALLGRSRAGAVAARMARAGTASWRESSSPGRSSRGPAGASGSEVDAESRRPARAPSATGQTPRPDRAAAASTKPRQGTAAGTRAPAGEARGGSRPARSAPTNQSPVGDTPSRPDSRAGSPRPPAGVPSRSPARPSTPGTAPAPADAPVPPAPKPPAPSPPAPSPPAPTRRRPGRGRAGKG